MQRLTSLVLDLAERGQVPDIVIRRGIRCLLKQRLSEIQPGDAQSAALHETRFVEQMRGTPIALVPEKANDQHYEVPVDFFLWVLGPHLKYSGTLWPAGTATLAEAEAAGLRESCLHADIKNGQTILELGCGRLLSEGLLQTIRYPALASWFDERRGRSRKFCLCRGEKQMPY